MKEFGDYDALGLAELVERGEVRPAELVEEAIRRVEQVNPRLNAVIIPLYERAMAAARDPVPQGPFRGVPFLVKDLLSPIADAPFTRGCKALKGYVAPTGCEYFDRLEAAGLITIGKTNTSELGILGVTEPEAYGPTRSPWNLEHSPGGSSGGSAAAVAAGIVPMASGGDGGGSIRIPSSCCGLFGLKPSRGRNPTGPFAERWLGAVVEHVLTRSVRDSAALLDATWGMDPGAPYTAPPPVRPFLEEVAIDPGPLTIAFSTDSPLGNPVHPECLAAVESAAQLLSDLGHRVEESRPDYDGHELALCYVTMLFGDIGAEIDDLEPMLGHKPRRTDLETITWALGLLGRATSASEFARSKQRWNHFSRVMGRFHQRYDLYLTPTMAILPPRIGELQLAGVERLVFDTTNALGLGKLLKVTGVAEKIADESLSRMPFTQLANLTGQPAMSVPLHWTAEGLPSGVQFMAPFADEATLFRLAGQLERAAPWFDRRPPVRAGREETVPLRS
jgi:amidase